MSSAKGIAKHQNKYAWKPDAGRKKNETWQLQQQPNWFTVQRQLQQQPKRIHGPAAASAATEGGSRFSVAVVEECRGGRAVAVVRWCDWCPGTQRPEDEESSDSVRSFGTEGRKKDGAQISASDKVYEYILFRGSDIKDLQVKSSPPVQAPPAIHDDPAIIQSHYSRPATVSTTLPSVGTGTLPDLSSHGTQMPVPRPTFQGGLPLYQPGVNSSSWGSSPPLPSANGTGLAMPMYWQGYYGPSSGLPHMQQPPLLRPPPGLPIPHTMQQPQPIQFPGMNTSFQNGSPNLPEFPSPLLQPVSSTPNLISTSFPSTVAPGQVGALASETSPSLLPNKATVTSLPLTALSTSLPFASSLPSSSIEINAIVTPVSSKPRAVPPSTLPYQNITQPASSIVGPSTSTHSEPPVHSLVTPGQLLQPRAALPSSSHSSHILKDVEVVQPVASSESSVLASTENQAPILPLPKPSDQRLNGPALYNRHSNRGRERGRGNGIAHSVTKFTEDFDFMAMNEKFKKDEVWGHLGKSKSQLREKEADAKDDYDAYDVNTEDYEEHSQSSESNTKPVYVKDDFFDSLSSNALDRGTQNGRTRFSEQMKLDTETFGDFPRHHHGGRGGRGGRGPGRGGRSRGSYYGGRGYGYGGGRGWGQTVPNRDL